MSSQYMFTPVILRSHLGAQRKPAAAVDLLRRLRRVTSCARSKLGVFEQTINGTCFYANMKMDLTRIPARYFLMLNWLALVPCTLELLLYEQGLPSSAPDQNGPRSYITMFSHRIAKRLRVTGQARYAPTQRRGARHRH